MMTNKELRTLDEMLTTLERWSTWNKTYANEMIGICSKMRNLLADRKTEPQTDGIIFKGNLKEGNYKLIKTTDGWVLEGEDIVYCGWDNSLT